MKIEACVIDGVIPPTRKRNNTPLRRTLQEKSDLFGSNAESLRREVCFGGLSMGTTWVHASLATVWEGFEVRSASGE